MATHAAESSEEGRRITGCTHECKNGSEAVACGQKAEEEAVVVRSVRIGRVWRWGSIGGRI